MQNPIVLTDAALLHIQNMINKNNRAKGFRLSIKKTGCSGFAYVPEIIEEEKKDDLHFVAQTGLNIFIDPTCLELIDQLVIDFVMDQGPGLKQKRLVFINPKESGRCGCGESFTIE
jgi:iron-sulfur cluster assembly accessory protein